MLKGYCSLSELCETEITDGTHQTPVYSDKGYIFLSSKNVTSGVIDWENIKYIPENLHNELYARIKPQKDDILLAKNGTTGVAALVDRDEVFDIYVSLALIRPDKNKVIPQYLLYAINSRKSQEFFKSNLKGIGVPNLHLTHIRETPIKVYSIEVQKQIIEELSCVDCLLKKYEKKLDILNTLVKSRFVEMFGDPVTNSKGIDKVTGKDLFVFSSGQFLSADKRSTEGIPVYGGNGVAWYTEKPLINYPTIIIGRVGALCGNIHLVNIPAWITDNAIYIKQQKKEMNLTFMAHLMEWLNFHQYANYSGQPKITQKPLERTTYIYPPLEQQNQFADFVSLADKSKFAVQQSIDTLQTLKAKLMQDYFG